jgi:uncharacterized protein with PIN domain
MDENVSSAIVNGLRLRGFEILTTQEAGMSRASDEEQLAFAKNKNRVIFTQDVDFLRLHARGINHSGIARQQTPVGDIIRGLILVHHVLQPDDMKNHIEFV